MWRNIKQNAIFENVILRYNLLLYSTIPYFIFTFPQPLICLYFYENLFLQNFVIVQKFVVLVECRFCYKDCLIFIYAINNNKDIHASKIEIFQKLENRSINSDYIYLYIARMQHHPSNSNLSSSIRGIVSTTNIFLNVRAVNILQPPSSWL